MQIVLNADLLPIEPPANWRQQPATAAEWSNGFASKWQMEKYSNKEGAVLKPIGEHQFRTLGFGRVVAKAYSQHLNLAIQPHDVWYVILANFAGIVNEGNAKAWRPFLTRAEGKTQLLVPQEHGFEINTQALLELLKEHSPTDPELFQPVFSTSTPEVLLCQAAAVLDMAKRYYDYGMFCCGIPMIDLRGTREDWEEIAARLTRINEAMLAVNLNAACLIPVERYFAKVQRVISQIILSYEQDQTEFWKDIWTQQNVGSGGDLQINGWICDLYHKIERGGLLRSFPDLICEFTYENKSTGEHFLQKHGCLGSALVDGVLETRYDYLVIKYDPK